MQTLDDDLLILSAMNLIKVLQERRHLHKKEKEKRTNNIIKMPT